MWSDQAAPFAPVRLCTLGGSLAYLNRFLTHLTISERVGASTQSHALAAVL